MLLSLLVTSVLLPLLHTNNVLQQVFLDADVVRNTAVLLLSGIVVEVVRVRMFLDIACLVSLVRNSPSVSGAWTCSSPMLRGSAVEM